MYTSALHKAGKQGGAPRYFSKRPALNLKLLLIKNILITPTGRVH